MNKSPNYFCLNLKNNTSIMRKLLFLLTLSIFFGCGDTATDKGDTETKATAGTDTKVEKDFVWNTE
ncbi:MAG: basic membrane lipoprotein Med (substrate-binding protein (PBP1-ABC) superfamily), partial [Polaribacter sp.]